MPIVLRIFLTKAYVVYFSKVNSAELSWAGVISGFTTYIAFIYLFRLSTELC
jgi:hypothetical protein